MTHQQHVQADAHAHENESILFFGVLGIINQPGEVVKEDRLCLVKGDLVLLLIFLVLVRIPLEEKIAHAYSVRTT
jgi:hypothetical protein